MHRLPADRFLHDPECPPSPRQVVDAHVHLFPPRVFDALWRWFHTHAWPVRYQLHVEALLEYLAAQQVSHLFALHFSHTPGMAVALNHFIAELARRHTAIIPFGTVLPGEPDALQIVDVALGDLDLVGLKLHCHVQRFAPDDPLLFPIYEALIRHDKVLVLHAGREPSIEAYGFDCRGQCGVERVQRVVERYPELKLVIPHLGHDEWREFLELARRAPNLHLDLSMAVGGYLTESPGRADLEPLWQRLLFGTDFPNLPYPWGKELHWLLALGLPEHKLEAVLVQNALKLVGRGGADSAQASEKPV